MSKKIAKLAIINRADSNAKIGVNALGPRGRVLLHCRDAFTFSAEANLNATIRESNLGVNVALPKRINLKAHGANNNRLSISFEVDPKLIAQIGALNVLGFTFGGSGPLTDGNLAITLTDTTAIPIASATGVGTTTATIKTLSDHGFTSQSFVLIFGITVPEYNTTSDNGVQTTNGVQITFVDTKTFTYTTSKAISGNISGGSTAAPIGTVAPGGSVSPVDIGPVAAGTAAAPGVLISAATGMGTPTAIITTTTPHNFPDKSSVVILGVADIEYNSSIPVTIARMNDTTFAYTVSANLTANSTGGTAALAGNIPVQQDIPVEFINDPLAP